MADDKKIDKERSVEERLKDLYLLQTLLSEIDRIRILRGELPEEVKDLEDEIVRFQTRIQRYHDEIEESQRQVQALTGKIAESKAKIDKYVDQQNHVRNNREFDFLAKEIEYEGLEIELAQKRIREAGVTQEAKQEEIARTQEELNDHQHILEDKRKELEDIVNETRQQVDNLQAKIKTIEPLIDDYTLKAFKRIRKNARNGLGIVVVNRDACGGCFNRIPPQRQLDIKMHKKVIVCEYCGRILIDRDLADGSI